MSQNGGAGALNNDKTVDHLKEGGDVVLEKLSKLFSDFIRALTVPPAWEKSDIMLVREKSKVKELDNYKPIALLSVVYKLFTKVIVDRIRDSLDFQQPIKQAGFRTGYSAIDHIHVITEVIETFAEYNEPFYYEKAFDSVGTAEVLEALKHQGTGYTYVRLLDDTYKGCTGRIIVHNNKNFSVKTRKRHLARIVYSMSERSIRKASLGEHKIAVKLGIFEALEICGLNRLFQQAGRTPQKIAPGPALKKLGRRREHEDE